MNISQNHKAISSAIATVLLIVGLAVGAGAGYFYVSSTASGTTKTITVGGTTVTSSVTGAPGPVTYTIGTVLPTTQTYGSYGVSFQNSVNLAVKQMNANLTAVGSNIQFKVVSADDAG
ncbi:MAG TPA: hypothetical protein VGS11_10235, partial [Candidatus Bathyarchaeia archaeon]|nr:hypothetical protein [Candidatus Bathyarchaeia archaeon]